MSHELRTLLHAIIGHAELLSEDSADPAVREKVAQIDAAAYDLLHAVEQLLELTNIESGKITLCYGTIELKPFISDIFEHAKRRCTGPDIHLRLQSDPRVKELVVDSQRLRHILDGLLSNALKYTKRGLIDLIVEAVSKDGPPFMQFVVSDTGIGTDARQKKLVSAIFAAGWLVHATLWRFQYRIGSQQRLGPAHGRRAQRTLDVWPGQRFRARPTAES